MSEINHDPNELLISSLANYSLVDIVHHIVGNKLAVISGYTQLLLREGAAQGKETSLLDLEKVAQREEKRLSYLRTMKQSEEEMNHFLVQLRGCSLATAERSFHEHLVKTALVPFFKQCIENFTPLYTNRTLQIHLPGQPLYVLCNHFWMTLVLEHIVTHTVAAHAASTPVIIDVDEYTDPSTDLHTARIWIHITRESTKQQLGTEETFEMRSHTLDEKNRDLCIALCGAIIREHGGRLGRQQEAEQREVVSIALPLVK